MPNMLLKSSLFMDLISTDVYKRQVLSVAAMTSAPRIEGMITTRLAKDAAQIAGKVPGAGVRFDVIVRILAVLAAVYIIKMASQVISMFLLTNSIQSAMHDMRNAVQDKIRRLPVKYFDTHSFGDTLSLSLIHISKGDGLPVPP